jgi:hypothetical protein
MKQDLFSRRKLGISGAFAVLLTGLAAGPALADPGQSGNAPCSPPPLSQPFTPVGDANSYMLAPGQTPDSFDATGWQLTGGAKIVTTQLADGQTGKVLDLPSGARAVSPTFCVQSNFPTARTMINDVTGNEGVQVYVSNNRAGGNPVNTGEPNPTQTGWTPSDPFDVDPSSAPGQQHVQFTFAASGTSSEYQIYDFYVDPRMCR